MILDESEEELKKYQKLPMEERTENIRKQVKNLPQAKALERGEVDTWIETVKDIDPSRLEWHFKRLAGIGGSDMKTVMKAANYPVSASYSSRPEDLARSKLMISPPEKASGKLKRGSDLEDYVEKSFINKMKSLGYKVQKRDDIIKRIGEEKVGPMQGNPDGVFTLTDENGKKENLIVDYKCPSPDSLKRFKEVESKSPYSGYKMQVNMYEMLNEKYNRDHPNEKPFKVDRVMVAPYNYVEGDTEIYEFAIDKKMQNQMKDASSKFFDKVKERDLQFGDVQSRLTNDIHKTPRLEKAARKLNYIRAMKKQLALEEKRVKNEMDSFVNENVQKKDLEFGNNYAGSIADNSMNFKVNYKLDTKSAWQKLKDEPEITRDELEQCRFETEDGKFKGNKPELEKALIRHHIDPARYQKIVANVTQKRGDQEFTQKMQNKAAKTLERELKTIDRPQRKSELTI